MKKLAYFIFIIFLLAACTTKNKFILIDSSFSGIHFTNQIIETDSINVLDFENVYNGGGVGVGDFNNDGLLDLYFTGNLVANKLYLNKGGLHFEDITQQAGVEGGGKWCRGVSIIDINNDGKLDVYVSATLLKDAEKRKNILYVNQGNNKMGTPIFKELAHEYGLDDTAHSTQANFFDYDNDGDLDVYIVNNEIISGDYPNRFRPILVNGEHPNTDQLFENQWDITLGHPVFKDISKKAGIAQEGYGHAVTIADINEDGWQDIYVTNDYLSNDLLWVNNKNGTFTNKMTSYFKHTSANAMGNDIVDLNNDGLLDVVSLDMNPEDNYRKKMMLNPNSYQTYQNSDYFKYGYQYVRNTLQVNLGNSYLQDDSIGHPIFGEIAFFGGVAETDWSWTPLVNDFDNDGNKDMIVTNGFPKDVTDHDFVAFRNQAFSVATKKYLLSQIPEVKIHNYAYRNKGNLQFDDVSSSWGMTAPGFSNGAASADLDNDGDLDIIINNINDKASVYENTTNAGTNDQHHYLQLSLKGDSLNQMAVGTKVYLYQKDKVQMLNYYPTRGYLSSMATPLLFGLGNNAIIDSVKVIWPDLSTQKILIRKIDTIYDLIKPKSYQFYPIILPVKNEQNLFSEHTRQLGVHYIHEERDFIDFNIQKLLPHKFSEYNPALAVGDFNQDGLEDFIVGGSFGKSAALFFQQSNGQFIQKALLANANQFNKATEDMGIVVFDVEKDGDLDIYIASGGYENPHNTENYLDHLFINNGQGEFSPALGSIPSILTSKSCVRAFDYDRDGDLDLFLAGRVDPWNYPLPVASSILRNDSKLGNIQFTDITSKIAPSLLKAGLICDALPTDFNNDGWTDLVLVGEWQAPQFYENKKGNFSKIATSLDNQVGWFNSILPADVDNDGDTDYIVGNLGQNSFYRANQTYPIHIIAKDFDKNESLDAVMGIYLPNTKGKKELFPEPLREDLVKQMIGMRNNFQNFSTYAITPFTNLFSKEQQEGSLQYTANYLKSSVILNNGKNQYAIAPLPDIAQWSAINGMVASDFDNDGNLDIIMNTNDYGTEVSVGRYDALNGLFLKGDGKGHFEPLSIQSSGIFIPGNGKGLVVLSNAKQDKAIIVAAQNRGPLKIFTSRNQYQWQKVDPDNTYALLSLKNGQTRKVEINYGASFLSQSTRNIIKSSSVKNIKLYR